MFGIKRIVVAQNERGLYLEDRSLKKILDPGVYWVADFRGRVKVEVYDVTVPEFDYPLADVLVKDQAALCEAYFQVIELGDREVGLVYKNGKLVNVLAPATRQLYWRGPVDVRVEVVPIEDDYEVPKDKVDLISRARSAELLRAVTSTVYIAEVADEFAGLLFVDGEFIKTMPPGPYAYWKFNRSIKVEQIDRRVQTMEVQGQEILTKDKVSLRVNLSAAYQVVDPVKARRAVADFTGYLYRALQFALREVIGTRTLDGLLSNKDALDGKVFEAVSGKMDEIGLVIRSVGIKDVILPGEMKDILNQVVQAEKAAQANIIKRREETAATRSLLNTARLMSDNPTLLRLKELEALEKVTEKVDKLTVFGGLDGVMQDVVKLNVKAE